MAFTALLQKMFKTLGVQVHLAASGGSYTLNPSYGQSTYSPWFEEDFQRLHREIQDRTLVTEDRCYLIHRFSPSTRCTCRVTSRSAVYTGSARPI